MLFKLIAKLVCQHNQTVDKLAQGCVDLFPADLVLLLGAAKPESANCANLVDRANPKDLVNKGGLFESLELLLDLLTLSENLTACLQLLRSLPLVLVKFMPVLLLLLVNFLMETF